MVFDQNHDQVGNRAYGDRLPPPARPLAAFCTLLSPYIPMLFMGEEYGEPAPFQFFSDHIDPKIAAATRDGRRQEFAAFAAFGEEIPDPQSIATFERSKLTRRRDAAIERLYAALLDARQTLAGCDVDTIDLNEESRWLRLSRGGFEMVCNFAPEPARFRCEAEHVLIATNAQMRLSGGRLELPGLSGALIS